MHVKIITTLFWMLFLPLITWSQVLPRVFGAERADVIHARLSFEAAAAFQRYVPPASVEAWEVRRKELRRQIIEKSGVEFFPNLDLDMKETGMTRIEGGVVKNIYFQTQPGIYATANLYIPDGDGPFPAVITMMGHSSNGKLYEMYQAVGHDLVRHGYVSLHIDPWGAGERSTVHGQFEYHGAQLGASLLNVGKTLLGMQLTDNIRGVDLLSALPFVDPSRIGATGASGGGNQTMWLTALDERIRAGMPVVSVGTFESYIMSSNCVCEMLPDGLTFMEESEVLGLVAPRALRVCNAEQEANKAFIPSEMKRSVANARPVFALYGAEDKLDYFIGETTHGYHPVYRESLIGWLDMHLKGNGDGSGVGTIEFHLPDEKKIMVFEPENRPQIVENTMDFFVRKQGELQRRGMEGPETERQRLRNILKSPQSRMLSTIHQFESMDGWSRFALETSDGYFTPVLLRLPESGSNEFSIIANIDGKSKIDQAVLDAHIKKGAGICLVDFWGIGEACSSTATRLDGTRLPPFHTLARSLMWLGTTLQGVWVREMELLVQWLQEVHGAEQLNYLGNKDLALAGVIYAALNPGQLDTLELENMPLSYAFGPGITDNFYTMSVHIPGFLEWGDVPALLVLSDGMVRISSPRRMDGTLLEEKDEIEKKYQWLAGRWGTNGKLEWVTE